MRKLIRQYEEKNRIIEEIQKNLRMVRLRGPRPQFKTKPRLTSISFKLDLPTINVRHEYSPRSVNGSPEKKPISLPNKQIVQQKVNKKPNKVGIQTISFNNEQESQIKPIILMNHRTTLRNFMLSTYRSQNSHAKNQDQSHKDIFLSTSKFLLAKQDSKILKQQDKTFDFNSRLSDETVKTSIKSIQKLNKPLESQDPPPIKRSKKVLEQITSTQMPKKVKDSGSQQEFDIKSFHTIVIAPQSFRKAKKKSRANKRSCSPWNSDKQGEQINELWNSNL